MALTGEMHRRRRAGERTRCTRHDGPIADVGATVLRWLTGRDTQEPPGEPFLGG